MKDRKLIKAMDLLNEKYIEEADLKRLKRRLAVRTASLVACICLLLSLTVTVFVPFSQPPCSDITECMSWNGERGSFSTGLILATPDTELQLRSIFLNYDINEFPKSRIYKKDTLLSYSAKMSAQYTLFNPTDSDITAKLLFPFNTTPSYIYKLDRSLDTSKYNLTVNGEEVDKSLRHTYSNRFDYDFDIDTETSKLCDTYAYDSCFAPDTAITKYTYEISGIISDDPQSTFLLAEWKSNPILSRYSLSSSGTWSISNKDGIVNLCIQRAKNGDEFILYVAGVPPKKELEWKCYETRYGENEMPGTATLKETQILSFEEYVLSAWDEKSGISKTDWYNAVIQHNSVESDRLYAILSTDDYDYQFMRWYEYDLTIGAGEQISAEITLPVYPDIYRSYEPYAYRYTHMLSFIETFESKEYPVESIQAEVNINTPYHLIAYDYQYLEDAEVDQAVKAINNFEDTDSGYKLSLNGLPKETIRDDRYSNAKPKSDILELDFKLCIVPDPTISHTHADPTFLEILRENILTIILIAIAITLPIAIALIIVNVKKMLNDRIFRY